MRKTLLFLAMLLGLTVYAQDPVIAFDASNASMDNLSSYNTKLSNVACGGMNWTIYGMNNNNNGWNPNPLRFGWKTKAQDATIATNSPITAKVSKVKLALAQIKTGANDKLESITLSVASAADFSDATNYTFEYTVPGKTNTAFYSELDLPAAVADRYYRVSFSTAKATNNGCYAINKVEFYGEADENAVPVPTITLGDNNTVTITAEEGLDIYYTTDGTEPTTTSTKYTAPFTISGKTTVKAIAWDGTKASAAVTRELLPNTVKSIAEYLDLANASATTIDAPLTAIYQNGRNLYLTDGTGFLLAYNQSDLATIAGKFNTNGDVLSSITGTYKLQAGLPEMLPTSVGTKSTGTPVEPEELAIEDIATDMLNHYVVIKNVSITAESSANNYKATDETGSIIIYNTFYNATYYDAVTVPEGEGFTVTGFVSCYNKTLQITPISITGGQTMETVDTPTFSPASGADLNAGDEISIECATAGATIHYTIDGTEPTASSPVYDGTLLFDGTSMTVKAFATKDGMFDSEVATAVYNLYVAGKTTGTFNFTNPSSLNPAPAIPTADNTQIKLNATNGNNVFTSGDITLTFDDGTNTSNSPVLIYPTGASTMGNIEGRCYKGNTLTFTANNATINKITFTQRENSTNWAGFTSDPDVTETNKTFVYTTDPTEVILTSKGTSRYGTIEVEYVAKSTAIDEIESDSDLNAPVEYFNLQGVRVSAENLTNGIYIRRQGSKVGKVFVK